MTALFHEQWVITLALTPLTLLLFGQVSVVGLAANALAIPWVTLLVTPLAMLGVLLTPLWTLAALALLQWRYPGAPWAAAVAAAVVAALWLGWRLARRLQGYTGDGLGATQQVCEIAFYLGLSLAL